MNNPLSCPKFYNTASFWQLWLHRYIRCPKSIKTTKQNQNVNLVKFEMFWWNNWKKLKSAKNLSQFENICAKKDFHGKNVQILLMLYKIKLAKTSLRMYCSFLFAISVTTDCLMLFFLVCHFYKKIIKISTHLPRRSC